MIREYLGMSKLDAIKRLPSYIRGAVLQTIASHQEVRVCRYERGRANVLLVPGLFCSSSVFNKLGEYMEDEVNVLVPPPLPYRISMLCNTGPVEEASHELCKELYFLYSEGVNDINLVCHSLGGIIACRAIQKLEHNMAPDLNSFICMGTPLNGSPITKLLGFIPACRDMQPDSNTIKDLSIANIDLALVSGFDSIVPSNYQIPFPSEDKFFDGKVSTFPDFQHMDFFVGTEDKVKRTAKSIIDQVKKHKES